MTRYMIRNASHGPVVYVATDDAAAARLRDLVAGKQGKATIYGPEDVEPLHRCDRGGWVWWSDAKMTTATGLPDEVRPRSLSPASEQLITRARGSDSGEPEVGWTALVQVQSIVEQTVVEHGAPRGYYMPRTVERLVVEMRDGTRATWIQTTAGYFEGYQCEIVPEPGSADGQGSEPVTITAAADLYDAIADFQCRVVDSLRRARDDGTLASHSPGALIGLLCGSIYGWGEGEDPEIYGLNRKAYDAALKVARASDSPAIGIYDLPECGLGTWPAEAQMEATIALARVTLPPDDPWWRCGWHTLR